VQWDLGSDPICNAHVVPCVELEQNLHARSTTRHSEERRFGRVVAESDERWLGDLHETPVGVGGAREPDELVSEHPPTAASRFLNKPKVRNVRAAVERGRPVTRASADADDPAGLLATACSSRIARPSDCVRGVPTELLTL
jgi:hypothetical protein